MLKNKKDKHLVSLYVVIKALSEDPTHPFLTITSNHVEASEFILKQLILDHKGHFDAWCDLQNKDKKSIDTQLYYLNQIVGEKEIKTKYIIKELKYTKSQLALILRLFNGCTPIGCSFDSPIEDKEYLTKLYNLVSGKKEN